MPSLPRARASARRGRQIAVVVIVAAVLAVVVPPTRPQETAAEAELPVAPIAARVEVTTTTTRVYAPSYSGDAPWLAAIGVVPVEIPVIETWPVEGPIADIPGSLVPVYRIAAASCPGLPWPVLAGIGGVETGHGRGLVDPGTGDVNPPIYGPPLDGRGGRARMANAAAADGWDRARGPMQFLESSWARWARLAPGRPAGAVPSVDNAWDSIFTAAAYLCSTVASTGDVVAAVYSYNHSDAYVASVLDRAVAYGWKRPIVVDVLAPPEPAFVPGVPFIEEPITTRPPTPPTAPENPASSSTTTTARIAPTPPPPTSTPPTSTPPTTTTTTTTTTTEAPTTTTTTADPVVEPPPTTAGDPPADG